MRQSATKMSIEQLTCREGQLHKEEYAQNAVAGPPFQQPPPEDVADASEALGHIVEQPVEVEERQVESKHQPRPLPGHG